MGMSWMFLYAAYQQIGVSIASLAYYCGPVIVIALAPLIFKEKLTLVKVAGFVAVLFGLLLINFQAFREGKTTQGIWNIASSDCSHSRLLGAFVCLCIFCDYS